jgi:hypothetical protein
MTAELDELVRRWAICALREPGKMGIYNAFKKEKPDALISLIAFLAGYFNSDIDRLIKLTRYDAEGQQVKP